jgi:topoisomerase-4 subunit A
VKRFTIEPTEKLTSFIGDHQESRLIKLSEVEYPRFEINFGGKNVNRQPEIIEVAEFISIKSYRARGKRLTKYQVDRINELEPLTTAHPEEDTPVLTEPEEFTEPPEPEEKKDVNPPGRSEQDLQMKLDL